MNKTTLDKLSDLVEKELDQLATKGTLNPSELDSAKKAVELMTCVKEYEAMCEEDMSGESYSERGMPRRHHYSMHYPDYRMIRGNYDLYDTYANTGNGNYGGYSEVRRDSMGRYSGHSIKDRMIDRLERMMDEAGSEYERKEIMEEITRLRQNS